MECAGCGHRCCYHCLNDALPEAPATGGVVCERCTIHRPPCPGDFNRYVPKKGCTALIPRNYELTVADCVAHLRWLVSGENHTLPNRCRACDCPMHRTAACAEVVHCGLRQCTVCGMSGLEFETHLIDHWHGEGRFGTCPRWPTDVFWDHTVTAQERCEEGVCHDEYRDCTDPAHKDYREQVVEVRRMRHARCCLASFPHELQRLVLRAIAAEGEGQGDGGPAPVCPAGGGPRVKARSVDASRGRPFRRPVFFSSAQAKTERSNKAWHRPTSKR